MATPQEMIAGFAQRIGIERPVFTENIATIQFDDMLLNLHADDASGEITLFMELQAVPSDPGAKAAAYSLLLRLNNFGRDTGGGVLGVDQAEQAVFFSRTFAVDNMTPVQFENAVESFLNLAEGFTARLSAQGGVVSESPPADVPPGGMRV